MNLKKGDRISLDGNKSIMFSPEMTEVRKYFNGDNKVWFSSGISSVDFLMIVKMIAAATGMQFKELEGTAFETYEFF